MIEDKDETPPQWMAQLTERENKEIRFCQTYFDNFAHGTTGHNSMMLVAKLSRLLDELEKQGHVAWLYSV